jgi:UDP:flavonoid glycosyltransferase YjiC (YdhE family)
MANFLMMPFGSSGDTFPYVGVGRALRARGHDVSVCANGYFKDAVERAQLGFHELGGGDEYMALLHNPNIWDPHKGFAAIVAGPYMPDAIRRQYRLIEELQRADPKLVVVAGSLAMGARIAEEKLGVKLANLHLQPLMFFSAVNPPKAPANNIPTWAPPWLLRMMYWFGDAVIFGPHIGRVVEPFRRELGLKKASRYVAVWMRSTQLEIGLFPQWFGYAPDWPKQLKLTGFPLYDDRADAPLPAEVEAFLAQGEPPVVVTFGTGMAVGEKLFAAAADACAALRQRALFLTPFRKQMPATLPPNSAHFDYVSLSKLLPHARALVHHGGIGTTSQALRAGIPQMITPLSHDQPDNADRVQKLGAGRFILAGKLTSEKLAEALAHVISDLKVRAACAEVALRMRGQNGIEETCAVLEEFAAK